MPDIGSREIQRILARAQEAFYTDPSAAGVILREIVGPDAVISVVPDSSSLIPGSMIAVTDTYTIVLISGTSQAQQLAAQFALGLLQPVNFGAYSTLVLWQQAALAVHERVALTTADPAKPVLIVGHSYGGAAAALVAANYRLGNPQREIALLTFGMPKPGDRRLHDILSLIRQVHIVNVGDPFPSLPPTADQFSGITTPFSDALLREWFSAEQPAGRFLLDDLGHAIETDAPSFTFAQLWTLMVAIFISVSLPTITEHLIATYVARLGLGP